MEGFSKLASEQSDSRNKMFRYLKKSYPEDVVQWAKKVDWKRKKRVKLGDIKMGRRPEGARETDKVKRIAQAVRDRQPMEPVVLVRTPDNELKIADGYHRTLGFKHANKQYIDAWVADVPVPDGPWDREMHRKKLNKGK